MPPLLKRLDSSSSDFDESLANLLNRNAESDSDLMEAVKEIIENVKANGDAALVEYSRRFDRVAATRLNDLAISHESIEAAWLRITETEREDLTVAANRIRAYHEAQLETGFEASDEQGNVTGQRITPLQRVGVYVPGGQAAYPSTALMTMIPARVAGVEEIVAVVPTPRDEVNDLLLAALHLAKVDSAWRIGGAQAVAALAFGTESIRSVDKIVGPGGTWVTAAKKLVFGTVGIDMIAGPSEILVIADGTVDPRWTALDLMSQSEHDPTAQSIVISPSKDCLDAIDRAIERLMPTMSRRQILNESLKSCGGSILTRSIEEAIDIANHIAPEHLQLALDQPRKYVDRIKNAGAIFLGAYSSEVLGDYVAGPNHVLPTYGTARFASPLGIYDFVKRTSVVEFTAEGADKLGRVAARIADAEGLQAHAEAARIRIQGIDHNTPA